MLSSPSVDDAFDVGPELLTTPTETKKTKKKRSRKDQPDSHPETSGRKKKRKTADTDGAERHQPDSQPQRKKDKECVIQQQGEDSDSDIDASAQATTTALLDAIVAAVSNTTPPEATPAPQGFAHPPPHLAHQHHFIGIPPFAQYTPGANPPFPGSVLNDLAYGSNDDILRTLQNMDVSKMSNLMRAHGDGSNAETPSAFGPAPSFAVPQVASPSGHRQVPTNSSTIMNVPATVAQCPAAPLIPRSESQRLNHAEILSTKWLNARKLADLVESEGLVYKKGKFSAIEERQLKEAIEAHKTSRRLSHEDLLDIIFPKNEKNKDTEFWTAITTAVPQRPIVAVYHHVRRTHHPMKQQGNWDPAEDASLKQAVTDLGQQWEKVSLRVGRMASDCRDRYRNHIMGRETRVSGAWSKEEEDELTRIVTDMTIKQGRDIDNDVFWSRVSQLMGGRRGRQQCRIKWTDSLSKLIKNDGMKPRWSHQDAYILVHKVDSLNVNDDTEIDWKLLPDPDWNLWSAHTLQRRWLTMKKSIKGFEEMSHQDVVDILRVKKSHLPTTVPSPSRTSKKKTRKITSATTIHDEASGFPDTSNSTQGTGTLPREVDDSEDSS